MKEARVLFVGNAYSIHVIWFTEAFKRYYPEIKIDFFHDGPKEDDRVNNVYEKIFWGAKRYPSFLYKIPKVRGFLELKDNSAFFNDFSKQGLHYKNIVFLRVPRWNEKTVARLHCVCDKAIVYPFGSEVLRCKGRFFNYINSFLQEVDIIATVTPIMRKTLIDRFCINEEKIRGWYIGNDNLDRYEEVNVTKDMAKSALNLQSKYVITCGYNGYAGQSHPKILAEIVKVKNELPENYILLILLTYGCDAAYVQSIRDICENNKLHYVIYDSFLTDEDLLYTRFATDIFIHAQPTDNGAGSIYEFLLAGAKMVNGSWVRYTQYEKEEIPYFIYNSFEELGPTILKSIDEENPCTEKTKKLLRKGSRRESIKDWANYILNDTNV